MCRAADGNLGRISSWKNFGDNSSGIDCRKFTGREIKAPPEKLMDRIFRILAITR
jgi:hypothetical protein